MNIPQVDLNPKKKRKEKDLSKRLLSEKLEVDPTSFICAVVLIMINFANMHGFVSDCENCLSGWARCLRTWHLHLHLHLHLQLRAGYPQPVRLQGPYATDGEDAHVSRAGLHRGIRLWAQAPGILHGSPQAQLHDEPGSPT